MTKFKTIRGMNDVTPSEVSVWQFVEASIRSIFASYAYDEIRFPIVEQTELFSRSVGESTDIVSKEMYTFEDRNGDGIALRPEGTAGCVRACLENDLLRVDSPRLWYMGPMFRYERPQKGRSRQFHQASAEVFGIDNHNVDAELMMMATNLWDVLGIKNQVNLEINSIGNSDTRKKYKNLLQEFFQSFSSELDKNSQRQLTENPLRILDSKSKKIKEILVNAPSILDQLDSESEDHFNKLKDLLTKLNINFEVNDKLVRGLDYYNKTVFEWKTKDLGAQDTVCGGGRYDDLVGQLGGKDSPAVGFSMGLERLILLVKEYSKDNVTTETELDCNFICLTDDSVSYALINAEKIREAIPTINLKVNLQVTSANSQFKRADKSGSKIALIVGEEELKDNTISIKDLAIKESQETLSLDQIINRLKKLY
ncbi:MAG: histidine--tRNA ligase [Gammaproteobacteria bacterium]|jgi:histidyl-tRNA synthetase|nr:histidine--tRNA ligase [SAR86 cluster bacterium]GIT61252.1 MAG: histidine--tRNA ligase [Gammaproteobacteria bacterium]|tara:strand:+ start:1180 stop:2454 length:1275 start_codon:yes stop_codon:yes gene_type:complete